MINLNEILENAKKVEELESAFLVNHTQEDLCLLLSKVGEKITEVQFALKEATGKEIPLLPVACAMLQTELDSTDKNESMVLALMLWLYSVLGAGKNV